MASESSAAITRPGDAGQRAVRHSRGMAFPVHPGSANGLDAITHKEWFPMDTTRFDHITRMLGARTNRRRMALGFGGLALGGLSLHQPAPAAAANERERCLDQCRDRCGNDPTNSKNGSSTDKDCYKRCQDRCGDRNR